MDAGKLRATRSDAPEFDLPDDFWTQAKLIEREQQVLASYVRAQKAQPR